MQKEAEATATAAAEGGRQAAGGFCLQAVGKLSTAGAATRGVTAAVVLHSLMPPLPVQ